MLVSPFLSGHGKPAQVPRYFELPLTDVLKGKVDFAFHLPVGIFRNANAFRLSNRLQSGSDV